MDIRDRLYIATMASDAAEMAATYGIGIELDQFCWAQNIDVNREKLYEEVDRMREITDRMTLHAPYSEISPAAFDKRFQELSLERLNQAYEIAAHFGIDRMVAHSGFIPCLHFPQWYYTEGVDFWKRFMEDKPDSFHIMIENQLEEDKDFLPEVCERINDPRVSLCLDIGHMLYSGRGGVKSWIDAFAPYCTHVHLHHNDRTWDHHYTLDVPGVINVNEVLNYILNRMPDATITLEHIFSKPSFYWLRNGGYLHYEDPEKGKKYQGMNSLANLVDE